MERNELGRFVKGKRTEEEKLKMSNYIKRDYENGIRKSYWLGKHHSKESSIKKSKALKGKSYEELMGKEKANELKEIRKVSCKNHFKKGIIPWNKGTKGIMKPNKTSFKSGEESFQWKGGISFLPYTTDFNKIFKLSIRQRDGLMCAKCGMKEEHCIKLFNRVLDVHHINYDKKVSIQENCISLCKSCHIESNINRESWLVFYQSILKERYGYCFINNKPIINLEVIKG